MVICKICPAPQSWASMYMYYGHFGFLNSVLLLSYANLLHFSTTRNKWYIFGMFMINIELCLKFIHSCI